MCFIINLLPASKKKSKTPPAILVPILSKESLIVIKIDVSAVHDHRLQISVLSSNIVVSMKMKFVALLHYTIDDPDGSRLGLLAKERINEKDKTFTYSVFFILLDITLRTKMMRSAITLIGLRMLMMTTLIMSYKKGRQIYTSVKKLGLAILMR